MDAPAGRLSLFERRINRLLVTLVTLGFLALLASGAAVIWFQVQTRDHSSWVEHSREVESLLGDFIATFERMETSRRGYLVNGDDSFRRIYDGLSGDIPKMVDRLGAATRDNARQEARVAALRGLLMRQQAYQRHSFDLVRIGDIEQAVTAFNTDPGVQLTRQIRRVAAAMKAEEGRLLVERDTRLQRGLQTFYAMLTVAGVLIVLLASTTLIVLLRYTRDLNASQAELRRLNENLEEVVEERTTDLRRANDEIQRFAYIVSHDLRSPLVNVMGFTAELDAARKAVTGMVDKVAESAPELVSREAELAVREDLPEAIGFIRTSTQKMDRLINAILRLSREGRRTLAPEPLQVAALIQGIVDSLHHRIEELGVEVRIEPPLPPLVSDRLAAEQIFSNLIENAIKYLQPGRPGLVVVRGRRERDRLIYEVEDNGRGVDPRDHERIFDLFRRSGAQDQPGEGIGLAHVRALAHRLGGIIDVRSELDRGATFRLSLPAQYSGGESS